MVGQLGLVGKFFIPYEDSFYEISFDQGHVSFHSQFLTNGPKSERELVCKPDHGVRSVPVAKYNFSG